jgi:Flp pilus assembly protein TadG
MLFGGFRRKTGKRDRRRGAAALEFALSMLVLTPVMIGICEYAYYFYIGINAVEAQRAGLLAVANTSVGATCLNKSVVQSPALSAVTAYFTLNRLNTVVGVQNGATTLVGCNSGPPAPTLTMSLVVDYQPVFKFTMPWEKVSPTAGYLRYTVPTLAIRGTP